MSPSKGPLIRKASSPEPFFPQHSLVTDFHSGDVGGLTDRLLASDLSLVVYYAPWDRSSQLLRWEVEQAAQFHHEQVSYLPGDEIQRVGFIFFIYSPVYIYCAAVMR